MNFTNLLKSLESRAHWNHTKLSMNDFIIMFKLQLNFVGYFTFLATLQEKSILSFLIVD